MLKVKNNIEEHRGGKREGAGRKPSGKKKRNYYVTDREHEEIKKLIEQIREDKKMICQACYEEEAEEGLTMCTACLKAAEDEPEYYGEKII